MGSSKGGGSETTVVDTTPSWLKDFAQNSTGKLEGLLNSQGEDFKNAYGDYNSLFSNKTGQSYLDAFSEAPKEAYKQALTDTKDMFGAKGLYGSSGNSMMSNALAGAGSQYASSMADAQIKAQQAQLKDYNASALKGDYQNNLLQQQLSNWLNASSNANNAVVNGQQVIHEEDSGKGGGFAGGVGGLIGLGLGGPMGGIAGTTIGGSLGSMF